MPKERAGAGKPGRRANADADGTRMSAGAPGPGGGRYPGGIRSGPHTDKDKREGFAAKAAAGDAGGPAPRPATCPNGSDARQGRFFRTRAKRAQHRRSGASPDFRRQRSADREKRAARIAVAAALIACRCSETYA